jgi:hypothetical protein
MTNSRPPLNAPASEHDAGYYELSIEGAIAASDVASFMDAGDLDLELEEDAGDV